jgi:NTE family protein
MDSIPLPPTRDAAASCRPDGCDRVALVLQGGGALGAYQGGVYQALHEAGLEPDWLAGVSIGSINAAIIAGNRFEDRLPRLRDFWETITSRRIWAFTPDGDAPRKARNAWSSAVTTLFGQPGFFDVNRPGPWLSQRGAKQATSYYDSAPLRETLLRLVDFDLINNSTTRFACGAVNVATGNFYYFDNAHVDIQPEHVMASGALPPALPMVQLGGDYFWDGGLVSNTPLQHLLDGIGAQNTLVFQVDLFSARGAVPRDMYDVMARQKDIQYSSRTRLTTDLYKQMHQMRIRMRELLMRVPDEALSESERRDKAAQTHIPEIAILQLIYQQAAYEGQAKDYEFSGTSMREHWDSGYRDTQRTLAHQDWLKMPEPGRGIVMHDIHRLPG